MVLVVVGWGGLVVGGGGGGRGEGVLACTGVPSDPHVCAVWDSSELSRPIGHTFLSPRALLVWDAGPGGLGGWRVAVVVKGCVEGGIRGGGA